MKLWILKPIDDDSIWAYAYDMVHGFVICAKSEGEARIIAQQHGGDECTKWDKETRMNNQVYAWTDPKHSTCTELKPDAKAGLVLRDFCHA